MDFLYSSHPGLYSTGSIVNAQMPGNFYGTGQLFATAPATAVQSSDSGSYGVGLLLDATIPPTVQALTPGLSAERSMVIRPGDQLLLVGGESALDFRRASDLVRGPMGTLVKLTLRRMGTMFDYEVVVMRGCKEYLDLFDEFQAQKKWVAVHKEAVDESFRLVNRVKQLEFELLARDQKLSELQNDHSSFEKQAVSNAARDVLQGVQFLQVDFERWRDILEKEMGQFIPLPPAPPPGASEAAPPDMLGQLRESVARQQELETQLMSFKADAERARDDYSEARVVTLEAELNTLRQVVIPKLNERLKEEAEKSKGLTERLEKELQRSKEPNGRPINDTGAVSARHKKCFFF